MSAAQKSIELDRNPPGGPGRPRARPTSKRGPRKNATVTRMNVARHPETAVAERTPVVGSWAY